jgi:hypothetical protein
MVKKLQKCNHCCNNLDRFFCEHHFDHNMHSLDMAMLDSVKFIEEGDSTHLESLSLNLEEGSTINNNNITTDLFTNVQEDDFSKCDFENPNKLTD